MSSIIHTQELQEKLIANHKKTEHHVKAFLIILAFIFAITALARPQWGDEKRKVKRKGGDIIFLLDTSLSMLAEDLKPNRLQKAKFEIETFVKLFKGNRTGMVAFAGSSFLQTPLTLDESAFFLFLDAIDVGYLPDPGTSLAQAVQQAILSFPEKDIKNKAIIILSDGEDHVGGIEGVIELAKKTGVRIYAIGMGTPEGDPIPLKDAKTGRRMGFKKNRAGDVVITKLNNTFLKQLANETGGVFLPSTASEKEVNLIIKHLETLEKRNYEERLIIEKEDQYQAFLLLALFFLCSEMLIRRSTKNSRNPALAFIMFFLFSGFFSSTSSLTNKGNDHYENKRYQSAIEEYRKAQVKNPDNAAVHYNLATSLYKTDAFSEAGKHLQTASNDSKKSELQALALYNYGNTLYRLGQYEKAIEVYKKALDINPDDKDAKYNLEFLQKNKDRRDKEDQEQKKQDQDKKDNQEQPNDQQNQGEQGQDPKDQNNQQNQSEEGQDKKDQQEQQKNQQNQDQNKQNKQKQPTDQQDQNKQEQQDQKDNQEQQKNQQNKYKQEQDKKDKQDKQPDKDQEKQGQNQAPSRPMQGQMKMRDALNLLDALKDAEKELQDSRRPPPPHTPTYVEKDW